MSNKFVLILDSTQLDTLLTCPTQWHYSFQERLIPSEARDNVPLNMGSYGHRLLEIYYKEIACGKSQMEAFIKAAELDVDKETCRCGHGLEHHGKHEIDLDCHSIGCQCTEFVPSEFPLSAPDREFVKQRVQEYTYVEGTYLPDLIPKSPAHVEVGFSHKLYEDDERLYILEGRIDLIGQIAKNCPDGWADHKFQARERDLYLKSIQFRNYALVTQLPIGVVNYIRFAKKIEKDKTFKRAIISFSRAEMQGWQENLITKYHDIEWIIKAAGDFRRCHDEFRNRSACSGKFGYPCDYTKLCEEFTNPQYIQFLEQSEYKQRPEWRPW